VDRGSVVADLRLKNVVGVVADPRHQSPKLHREIRAKRRVTALVKSSQRVRGEARQQPCGRVALCGYGKYSHSESRSGTCSENNGIRQWCPCGTAPSLASAPAPSAADDDDFVALAVSLITGRAAGWGTAGSQISGGLPGAARNCARSRES
jgi:hypothetical protein